MLMVGGFGCTRNMSKRYGMNVLAWWRTRVYYNTLILSEVLDELQKRGEVATIEAIKRVSPIAWQHINFYGHYLFDADFSPIDLAVIRQHLTSVEVRRFYAA